MDKNQKDLPSSLHLYSGLDFFLSKGINRSDILLFVTPEKLENVSSRKAVDVMDASLTLLHRAGSEGHTYFVYQLYYSLLYGKNIMRNPFSGKSWQGWELETAKELNIPIVSICLTGKSSIEETTENKMCIRKEFLEEDLRQLVYPKLNYLFKSSPQIRSSLVIFYSGALLVFGFVAGVSFMLLIYLVIVLIRVL